MVDPLFRAVVLVAASLVGCERGPEASEERPTTAAPTPEEAPSPDEAGAEEAAEETQPDEAAEPAEAEEVTAETSPHVTPAGPTDEPPCPPEADSILPPCYFIL